MARVYISGKITGLMPEVAKEMFDQAAEQLQTQGHTALNPMEIWPQNIGWHWTDYLADNVRYLLKDGADTMYMLANWRESKGARIERAVAVELGLHIIYQDETTAA